MPIQRQNGFTMVETLVSTALLLMLFAAIATIFDVVTSTIGYSRIKVVATALATEKIETVRNLAYTDIGTLGGIPNGVLPQTETITVNGQDFTVKTTVLYVDDPFDNQAPSDPISTDYKRVRVSITWGGAFPSISPVVLNTTVVPDGLETNEGGGTLILYAINSSGEPVANATARIINDTVDPTINLEILANDEGQVILPGAPECSDCYRIEVTKDGYSQERTYSLTEVANPLRPDATIIEGEITALTFTIDETVTINVESKGPRSSNYPSFAGVGFIMRGSKTIGTDDADEPIYKYQESLVTGAGGRLELVNIEPDIYEIWIPEGASVDFAGSAPISPFKVLPGVDRNLLIVTEPTTPHNLLVVIQDIETKPIGTASATLSRPGFIATGSAGPVGAADNGQFLFKNLLAGNYTLMASQSGYLSATSSATVNGDSKVYILLEK